MERLREPAVAIHVQHCLNLSWAVCVTEAETGGVVVMHDAPFAAFDHRWSGRYEISEGDIAPTMKPKSEPAVATTGTRTIVRRLTPLECERLMGWPDNYTAHGITDEGEHVDIANTNRYRICGNGIVATVTEWIGNRLPTITSDDYVDETKTSNSNHSLIATSQT